MLTGDLADTLLTALLDAVRREFEAAHGRMKGGAVALIAMGRLGGREMTAASDLDLLLLYDFDEAAAALQRQAAAARRPLFRAADAARGGGALGADGGGGRSIRWISGCGHRAIPGRWRRTSRASPSTRRRTPGRGSTWR
ncbi:MAG: hypothetical protein WDM84_07725 [Bauldia sp.]